MLPPLDEVPHALMPAPSTSIVEGATLSHNYGAVYAVHSYGGRVFCGLHTGHTGSRVATRLAATSASCFAHSSRASAKLALRFVSGSCDATTIARWRRRTRRTDPG